MTTTEWILTFRLCLSTHYMDEVPLADLLEVVEREVGINCTDSKISKCQNVTVFLCHWSSSNSLCSVTGERRWFKYVQFPNHSTLHSCARRRCWGIMFASYPGAHCNVGILGEGHLTLGQLDVDLSECISLRLWLTGMAESTLGQRLCPDAQCHAGWVFFSSRWWEFFSSLSCDPKRSK